ncbi:MAG: hypothetical protein IPH44_03305 [Myxococcales bacterium]|nr:hypothetical protein [Myxococcales bacterium]MBK7198344.1 hypothetical protein [Myxococcales bacterium]
MSDDTFDKRAWHPGRADHVGAFLAWAAARDLARGAVAELSAIHRPLTLALARRLGAEVGGVFGHDLTATGAAFAAACYSLYLEGCEELSVAGAALRSAGALRDVVAWLDELFADWSAAGRPATAPVSSEERLVGLSPPLPEATRVVGTIAELTALLAARDVVAGGEDATADQQWLADVTAAAAALRRHPALDATLLGCVAHGAWHRAVPVARCLLALRPAAGAAIVRAFEARPPADLLGDAGALTVELRRAFGDAWAASLEQAAFAALDAGRVPHQVLSLVAARCTGAERDRIVRACVDRVSDDRARPQLLAELVEAWAQTDVGAGQPSGALTDDQVCQALAAGASPRLLASIRLMTALDADATMSAARARRVADAVARDLALIATIPSPRHRYEAARELAAEVSVLAKAPGLADLHRRAAAMRDELQRTVEIRNELLAAARSAHPIPADTLRAGREWLHAAASPADIQRIVDTTSLARNPGNAAALWSLLAAFEPTNREYVEHAAAGVAAARAAGHEVPGVPGDRPSER